MPFVKRANTHQLHWEDLVLLGPDGLEELDDKIEGTLEKIQDSNSDRMNITTKIDGSPALFCWSSYAGLPNNSVSLKSFVKDTAADNCISSPEQVDQKYGDRPTMAQMLKYGLELAKSIPAGECWQGDCLFTKDSKREEEINGKDYITFQPNKIIYAFSEGQPGYEQVKNADFGICFHTIYSGENKAQTFKVDPTRLKNVPSNFYIMSPALNVKGLEKFNFDKIKTHVDRLNRLENQLVSNDGYTTLVSNAKFMKDYWNTFENKVLADNKQVTINENTFIEELKAYINEKLGKDIDKLKSEKGKAGARKKLEDLLELVDSNRQVLTLLVKTLNEAALIKMLLWEGFKQSKSDYDTFYKSKTRGYFDADMEGIAVSDQDGNIVKIVDRSAFSSYNRDPDIESGWEHESLSEACLRREFNRLTEDETPVDPSKVLVFSFGKFNPPTIGHVKLAQAMANCDESSNKPVIYLSHKYGLDKKNPLKSQPLDYKEKVYWCKKAFGNLVDVVESNAQTAWEALHEINEKRPEIERIVFAGGDDRADGSMFANLANSNGKQTSKPSGDYNFVGGIVPLNAGARDEGSSDLAETASSSLVRRMALDNDFEKFKQLVPFDENDADELFDEIRDFYKDGGTLNEEILTEAPFKTNEISKHDFKYLDKVADDYVDNKEIEYVNGETHKATDFKAPSELPEIDRELDSIKNLSSDTERVKEFNELTGLTWTKIYKGNYSGYSGDKAAGPGIGAEKDLLSDSRKQELILRLMPYIKQKYSDATDIELVEPKHLGGANSKRDVSLEQLFTVKDLYKDKTEGGSTSDKIADVQYTAVITTSNGEVKEPIYLSVKEGPTVSPINLGINKVPEDTIINVLTKNIKPEEKNLMKAVLNLRGTTAKGVMLIAPEGTELTNWYYQLPQDELEVENYKNAIINSYGNNYWYYHVGNGKIIDFRPVSEIIEELSKEEVSNASLTITPARFVIQFNLGDLYCRLFFRRKGSTSMFLLTEVKKGLKGQISFTGQQINDLKGYKFNIVG